MIAQHHEMHDGKGIPQLPASKICPRRQFSASSMLSSRDAQTHSSRQEPVSTARNRRSDACDKPIAPEWILPFNTVIRKTIES